MSDTKLDQIKFHELLIMWFVIFLFFLLEKQQHFFLQIHSSVPEMLRTYFQNKESLSMIKCVFLNVCYTAMVLM